MLTADTVPTDTDTIDVLPHATLADLIDELRPARRPATAYTTTALSSAAELQLERAIRDYERESEKTIERRSTVGAMAYASSEAEIDAACDFVALHLGLRVVDIDVRDFAALTDEEIVASLATLGDSRAHVVALRGLDFDLDVRVASALALAGLDVFVLGFAAPGAIFEPAVRRRLKHQIDLSGADALPRHEALRGMIAALNAVMVKPAPVPQSSIFV